MIDKLLKSNFAIIGGGRFCKNLLALLNSDDFANQGFSVLGVADINPRAEGLLYADKMGILITEYYKDLYRLENLQFILELTGDARLAVELNRTKPDHVTVIDHVDSRTLWTSLQVEKEKRNALKALRQKDAVAGDIDSLFEQFADRLGEVVNERSNRYVEIERELIESEEALSQIIEGSTIPTFVINKEHIITHWNRAMENLTGVKATEMVGTTRQSTPFWGEKRPTMADVILDQIGEADIKKLYGEKWRKSVLIEEAYEAEVFFPRLGETGKWCWFTAAPIKGHDGTIVGAIETLWDKTEDKKAEVEREYHTRELSTLCSIYSALNAPTDLDSRIDKAARDLLNFLSADGICIYMRDQKGQYTLHHSQGLSDNACKKVSILNEKSIIHRVAETSEFTIYENLPEGCLDEIYLLEEEKIQSLAYVPISSKEKKTLGVIRIGSKTPTYFNLEQKNVLELIGNRIGLAIENAMLQEQYIKSEEKYRTLFNSDPHPIFILDSQSFKILDMNKRAQDSYGYTPDELRQLTFLQLGDENDEELIRSLQNLTEDQSILFTKKRHNRKGGKPFFVNLNVSMAKYGAGHAIIATSTDMTEVVEKETQLIQAGKMTTLGVMAAGMAHEINQPLNVIQVCADFFLKMLNRGIKIEDDDMRSMANDIVANVDRATGVIKHVRDFARQSEPVRTRVNINDPIQDVFKVLGHQLKVHEIDVTLDLNSELPEIMAEHNRLEQVFINLVSNAIDAMDEKSSQPDYTDNSKKLNIRSVLEDKLVTVYVTDTGTGMSEEVQAKLFEPFFTTKKVGKGTGLGVSISYGIVTDYDGNIEIESEVGKGTTFKLTFPAAGT